MTKYIECETVREILCGWCHERESCDGSCLAEKELDAIPAVDVAPVRHGRWENGHCTRCGEDVASRLDIWTNVQRFLYCPFCGALMDKDGDEE